jgi:hypothetical protein
MLRLLLWARARAIWNGLTRAERPDRNRARRAVLFTLFVGVAIGTLGYGFIEPFAGAAADDVAVRDLLTRAPALGLFSAFWLLILSGITAGIQTFYLNPEIGLLLAAPVRTQVLVTSKLMEATAANAALFLSTAAPLLAAYGLALHRFTAEYVAALGLVLVAFSVLPTGLGLLAAMILMRMLPAGRTRDVLAAVGVAFFALLYFALSTSVTRIQHADPAALRSSAERLLQAASSPLLRSGPWAWAGQALGGPQGPGVWMRVAMLVGLAAVSVLACSAGAQTLFFPGWAAAQEADSGARTSESRPRPKRLARPLRLLASALSPPVRAVFVKDMVSLTRDMRQLSMLFIPLAVIAVFIANLRSSPAVSGMESLLFVQTLLVILAPISLRVALVSYVAENRAFWLVIAAPNPPRAALLGKYIFACTLSLPIGIIAAVAYAWAAHLGGSILVISLGLVICAMLTFCGIGIGASARFCDFSAENARFTMTVGGRLVVFGIQLLYMIAMGILNVGAWALIRFHIVPPPLTMASQALAVGVVSSMCVVGMLWWGSARLRKIEW